MPPPPAPAPIVLVHGILGFDQLRIAGVTVARYFRLIPDALRARGFTVPDPPTLSAAGPISQRAQDLKRYLTEAPGVADRQVHLVAHSMGGLDARFMLARLNMDSRILSLTTVGTPHVGSPIADLVPLRPGLADALEHVGLDMRGIADLTTSACARFNTEVTDSSDIRYYTIAGTFQPPRLLGHSFGLLGPTHDLLFSEQGENDGLVSAVSAQFRERADKWTFLGTWKANHFQLINWGANIWPTSTEEIDSQIVNHYIDLATMVSGRS